MGHTRYALGRAAWRVRIAGGTQSGAERANEDRTLLTTLFALGCGYA